MKPIVAIVGRPNVGKSALFNRLVRERLAVVEDFPGVTRDRLYAEAIVGDRTCVIVDTGGFDPTEKQGLLPQVVAQARFAVAEAHAIVFVVDATQELTSLDFAVAEELRRTSKPIVVAVNKADNETRAQQNFHDLGLAPVIPVSALHGRNVEELVDAVAARLPPGEAEAEIEGDVICIAIVGRPNVGKSSLTNAILGEERTIVSEVPGTTRDAVDTECAWGGHRVVLIDTAGLRRKAKVTQAMEYHSVLRSLRAIERADVVFLVVEHTGITEQDTRIGGYAHEAGKAIVITVNKWDKITDQITSVAPGERSRHLKTVRDDFARSIHSYLAFMEYAPVHYVSALRHEGIGDLMSEALRLATIRQERIPTAQLNAIVRRAVIDHPPPTFKGRQLKIRYATQVATTPPTIVLFVNDTKLIHFSYRRYLDNQIRKAFDFRGTPLRLYLRAGKE